MNKLVTAAVVGGAALAVGILPAAGIANAAMAPTPIPVTTTVSAPTHAPAPPSHGKKTTKHRKTKRKHAGSHKTKGHKTTGHRPVRHRHAHQPGKHKPVTKQPVTKQPVTKRPVTHKPVHKPVRKPVEQPPVSTTPVVPAPVHKAPVHKTPVRKAPVHRSPVVRKPVIQPTVSAQAKRIIGGKDAPPSPWAAQINWDNTGFECTGTAIAPQWVLTAGHCANTGGMSVLIGSNDLGQGTQDAVDQSVVDPTGDLSLLHLTDPVQTTFVKLADSDPKVGAIDQIYGFGKTDPNSGPSQELKVAKVKVTSVDCQDGVQGKAICSTGINGNAFNGDSGGPEMEKDVEVGVCSTGDASAKTQEYASVAANRDWIQQVANV